MQPAQDPSSPQQRLALIASARHCVLHAGEPMPHALEPWIVASWHRCLMAGQRPAQRVGFDLVHDVAARRAVDASHALVAAARPVMRQLAQTMASTRYFAILTDAQGIVVDADGPIDRRDRRAHLITRIGVDLSERAVGTTAIGAALTERRPVWLHRGEHFYEDTSVYSCAGAPIFGPDGLCLGMLDLTGIEAVERPELRHLVARSTRVIENALVVQTPHALRLHLRWPGATAGGDDDGLLCLDRDGWVVAANPAAREMIAGLHRPAPPAHASELFAQSWEALFDLARIGTEADLPLWSGLRLRAHVGRPDDAPDRAAVTQPAARLRDVELSLIRKAVRDARGNVMEAARALGISRATVYRRLGQRPPREPGDD